MDELGDGGVEGGLASQRACPLVASARKDFPLAASRMVSSQVSRRRDTAPGI